MGGSYLVAIVIIVIVDDNDDDDDTAKLRDKTLSKAAKETLTSNYQQQWLRELPLRRKLPQTRTILEWGGSMQY